MLVTFALWASFLYGGCIAVELHHRILIPGARPSLFTHRASLELTPTGIEYKPSSTFKNDLDAFFVKPVDGSALYQVALEREAGDSQDEWDLSSVRACHMAPGVSDILSVHVSTTGAPFAVDYHVQSPPDGSCPTAKSSPPTSLNTTVRLVPSTWPPLPELRVPPPLSAEGTPIKAAPEPSFFQKYWLYIAGAFLALTLLMPAEPPAQEGGGGGGAR